MSGQPITLFAPPRRRLRRCRAFLRRHYVLPYVISVGLWAGILVAVVKLW